MNIKKEPIVPAVPSSFFSSLTPEQQKQLNQVLKAYQVYYSNYYGFSGKLIKQNGFIAYMFSVDIWKEVIVPSGMTKNMFILMQFIYFLQMSDKFKDERLTIDLIIKEIYLLGSINRLWPTKNVKYLVMYGWCGYHSYKQGKRAYFVTEKGIDLLTKYNLAFQRHFNEVFLRLTF